MNPYWFFKIACITVTAISLVILYLILFTTKTYVHSQDTSNLDNATAAKINAMKDQWPFKLQFEMKWKYIKEACTIPSPNMDVSDDELTAAWYLPSKTRLSPMMRQSAHCDLVARNQRGKTDTSVCHCVDTNDMAILLVVALLATAVNVARLLCNGFPESLGCVSIYGPAITYVVWWIGAIKATALAYSSDLSGSVIVSTGLAYTPYGDIHPINYYSSIEGWKMVLDLVLICMIVSFAEFFVCFLCWMVQIVKSKIEQKAKEGTKESKAKSCSAKEKGEGEKTKKDNPKV